ncbi:MAG: agmatine deiminase family protein [Chloroflexota bacterium]|nr:agmatine deiminase family protein [Chloroflexota bacterium]
MIPLRFDYIPYPLWRRDMPAPLRPLARTLLRPFYPLDAETQPPTTPEALADYLARWRLLPHGMTRDDARRGIAADDAAIARAPAYPPPPHSAPIRLPAQWEPMERILLTFPVLYPPLWAAHAQMIAAITPVADVTVLVPAQAWASAIRFYLHTHGVRDLSRVEFLELPTDDIWVRDYGPFVGQYDDGNQAVVNARFEPLAAYPQAQDDAAAARWSAHAEVPMLTFDFLTEGGNYWSDGAGTLIVNDEMLARHPDMTQADIERKLREAFAFQKLIVLPRLLLEETGHIDLLCKLCDAQTILLNQPNGALNDERLRAAADTLRRAHNAQGQPYTVIPLPFPRLYYNWGIYPVWRSYTNSLTVNGRVLVPIFGVGEDAQALDSYCRAMPQHTIIPIDCRLAANGGGAVHCLTKEVPAGR